MSDFIPVNDLDKAIMAAQRSKAALPELCRCLCQGDLCLLVPFHPEIVDADFELKNGMPLPFARLETKHGVVVAAYSSESRVEEGLKKGKIPPNTFAAAVMPALQVLEILGKMDLQMVVNKGCATGEVTLPAKLLRDLADGTALKPLGIGGGKTETLTLQKIDPAEYPTTLLQAAFDFFRLHKNFRAAWIFTRTIEGQPAPELRPYYLLVLMEPRDEKVFHDFNLVAQSAREKHELNLSVADEKDTGYIASLFRQNRPFFKAADYEPPDVEV